MSNTTSPSGNRPTNIKLGVALVVCAAFGISVQDVIFKLFSTQLSLWQIFALRGCIAVPLLVFTAKLRGEQRVFVPALGRWPLLRALFITTTFLCFYAALPFLSLSTVGAANYIAPIFVTLLSAYVIGESVGWSGWLGVLLGFIGVVVLLQPGSDAFSPWALLPVAGAAFYALAHIATRTKCQSETLTTLSLAQNLVMMLSGFVVSAVLLAVPVSDELVQTTPYIFGGWSPVGWTDVLVLALLACFAVGLGILLAGAYKAAPPSKVATFEYTYLIFVAIWDVIVFATLPGPLSVAGMLLIVAAGLLVLRRPALQR